MSKKYSKIRQKIKQIKSQYNRKTIDPIRNIFAINSLGAIIVISILFYVYIAGIFSLFIDDIHLNFIREVMRILECIAISIVSYFFGGMFKKECNDDDNTK